MEPIVRAKKLEKVYRSNGIATPALRGVDLEVRPGEFTAIAGPSGSGKSTLLHLLGGLDRPSAGEVWLEGERVDDKNATWRARLRLWKVGFVFQAYNLIPVLTALENAAFVLELRGVPPAERRKRALDALAELEMQDYAARRPNQLSGGQQQRVAVARALAAEPAVILADEPTANLDSKTGRALIEYMKRLNREKGLTFLFSTHDPRLLEHVRRIVRLEDGRVVGEEVREA
ncbi:ABC transporter ATP-binding protein [Oceanithermus sp.]|uniref:ABC transporter ATP-binding protein n=1 Tax=Oceanithermus sp. TaxID=2268145 RepID=UPI0025DAC3CC|nr:ABC transporter ATP-binding protein [Oceanithermus sp.]